MHCTRVVMAIVVVTAAALLIGACGSGYDVQKGNAPQVGETIGTITGVINYQGTAVGHRLVVGLIENWPMDKPPVRFYEILDFGGNFPTTYEFELDEYLEGKSYYLASFLDVDPDDVNLMMNSELDPMDLPKRDQGPVTIHAGVNVQDFILLDPDQVDFWWEE